MKLVKLVCLEFNGNELEANYWQEIDELCEIRELANVDEAVKNHSDADGLLVKLGAKIPKELMGTFPNLKYIGMIGTGYGTIDVNYATQKGITVTNIADYSTEAVTEFTFAILLEHLRDIAKARKQAEDGDYSDDFSGSEIKGKKFGVIGLGAIGMRTAEIAQAFGANVCYWSRNRKVQAEEKGIQYCELDKLLEQSDIISLNLALSTDTKMIINKTRIDLIKKGAIFINPSPMEMVDFEALVDRLQSNDMVLTFMLDHSDEMSEEQLTKVQKLDNCIVYPPVAYLTKEAGLEKKRIYVENIRNFVSGTPTNKVN